MSMEGYTKHLLQKLQDGEWVDLMHTTDPYTLLVQPWQIYEGDSGLCPHHIPAIKSLIRAAEKAAEES
jgi:hypothetical protein